MFPYIFWFRGMCYVSINDANENNISHTIPKKRVYSNQFYWINSIRIPSKLQIKCTYFRFCIPVSQRISMYQDNMWNIPLIASLWPLLLYRKRRMTQKERLQQTYIIGEVTWYNMRFSKQISKNYPSFL